MWVIGRVLGHHPSLKTVFFTLTWMASWKTLSHTNELYIGETKQPLHTNGTTQTGQDSAVHLHLKESKHSFEDSQVCPGKRRSQV